MSVQYPSLQKLHSVVGKSLYNLFIFTSLSSFSEILPRRRILFLSGDLVNGDSKKYLMFRNLELSQMATDG